MDAIYSQLLGRKLGQAFDEETAEYLSYVGQGARRIEALVRALVSYSEAGTGAAAGPVEPAECQTALTAALANLRLEIEDTRTKIKVGILPAVHVHLAHLIQVFQNLISNAIRYHGDHSPRIEVAAKRHIAEWEFSILDNGISIPQQHRSQVFGVFKRLSAPGSSNKTGVGLAICKRIVERHRGRIWIESAKRKGSVFYFTLLAGNQRESTGGDST